MAKRGTAVPGARDARRKVTRPEGVHELKVILLGTDPPVWRRLLVPSDATLERLHRILQVAMGWEGYHMHEFVAGGKKPTSYGVPSGRQPLAIDAMWASVFGRPEVVDERTVKVRDVLPRPGSKLRYEYDFGDSWVHEVRVERILPADDARTVPLCTDGARACPPEDCGGEPGYAELLEALSDPKHERHKELLEWVGGAFDPEAFDVEAVSRALRRLR